jgi:hypothetical protein
MQRVRGPREPLVGGGLGEEAAVGVVQEHRHGGAHAFVAAPAVGAVGVRRDEGGALVHGGQAAGLVVGVGAALAPGLRRFAANLRSAGLRRAGMDQ